MKRMIFLLSLAAMSNHLMAQTTTVTFKPGASIGQDAHMWALDNNCVPTGYTSTPANMNFGNHTELFGMDWTWFAAGCQGGTIRSLFRFSQLATIPSGATILSATLKLYGVSSSSSYGNSSYPGSPFTTTNESWLSRVTSNWTESGVTWNTQPTTTGTGAISVPATNLQWNWNYSNSSAALVSMVQGWVSSPATNYGLQLRLQNEAHYRGVMFASSDHADSTRWPELTVTYEVCDANFKYCASSANPNGYSFDAATPGVTYSWSVNGTVIGTAPSIGYLFTTPGTYTVCLKKGMEQSTCKKCVTLCIPQQSGTDQPAPSSALERASDVNDRQPSESVPQGSFLVPDVVQNPGLLISPNPASGDWQIRYEAFESAPASLSVFDATGKLLETREINLKAGVNQLTQTVQSLAPGVYFIEIKGAQFMSREKAIKL